MHALFKVTTIPENQVCLRRFQRPSLATSLWFFFRITKFDGRKSQVEDLFKGGVVFFGVF